LQGPAAGNSRAPLLRAAGYLRLQDCRAALGCAAPAGLYGRSALGEAVAEFSGGRSVLRNRSFRWADASQRPEVLARTPALLEDLGLQAAAQAARAAAAEQIKQGLDAFKDNRYDAAESLLRKAQAAAPGEAILSYYLGLIALRREDTANALALLQQYSRDDPAGAAERELPKTLTLLSSNQLQQEVSAAVAREREIASTPPEPGSIAVQAFVSRAGGTPSAEASRDAYAAMAKGLAAMIIADLSKVPGLKVLEREKVQLLVDEARLGSSGIADPRSAVRTGQLLRAEKVIVGNFEVQ
jgi:TolB-like protein